MSRFTWHGQFQTLSVPGFEGAVRNGGNYALPEDHPLVKSWIGREWLKPVTKSAAPPVKDTSRPARAGARVEQQAETRTPDVAVPAQEQE
ncbi:hypothetical protein [Camelimonas lactis]|nr:hypothetical protein [Camelimonas lactis]